MEMHMKLKLDKYWGDGDKINFVFYVTVVLDAREKLRGVKSWISKLKGKNVGEAIEGHVTDCLKQLCDFYANIDEDRVETPHVRRWV